MATYRIKVSDLKRIIFEEKKRILEGRTSPQVAGSQLANVISKYLVSHAEEIAAGVLESVDPNAEDVFPDKLTPEFVAQVTNVAEELLAGMNDELGIIVKSIYDHVYSTDR